MQRFLNPASSSARPRVPALNRSSMLLQTSSLRQAIRKISSYNKIQSNIETDSVGKFRHPKHTTAPKATSASDNLSANTSSREEGDDDAAEAGNGTQSHKEKKLVARICALNEQREILAHRIFDHLEELVHEVGGLFDADEDDEEHLKIARNAFDFLFDEEQALIRRLGQANAAYVRGGEEIQGEKKVLDEDSREGKPELEKDDEALDGDKDVLGEDNPAT